MVSRIDIKRLFKSQSMRNLPLVVFGCALAAFGLDTFLVPNGLAAGGVTGLATITSELAARQGFNLPVGIQTIAVNILLLALVIREGGALYVFQTVVGFGVFGIFTDLFVPFTAELADADIMLPAIWGGIICGIGYGIILRCGYNTGGSDTISQVISRRTSLPVGATIMAIDLAVCACSIPVFSLEAALYAALSMIVNGFVVDWVIDGGNRRRMALIISDNRPEIEADIMFGLDRGCTELRARGCYTDSDRPVLMVILERREIAPLKAIVASHDPEAIVIISDVTEAFGEGFKALGD